MSNHLSYLRTDRAIVQAFMTLLEKKPLERITVKDIMDEALIGRNTFYTHYRDKYEIIEKLNQELIEKFDVCFKIAYNQSDAGDDQRIPLTDQEGRAKLYEFFQENARLIQTLSKIHVAPADDATNFFGYLSKYFRDSYVHSPVNQHKRHPWMLECEADLYEAMVTILARHSLVHGELLLSEKKDYTKDIMLNACLFAIGVRDKRNREKIKEYAKAHVDCADED